MENENNNEFVIVDGQKTVDAGTEVKDIDGNQISSDDFKLVQQDKSIHDTKFTTKPTTFFKDAMKRFSKNRSSVVGGAILGIIFVLSLILPINGVLPFDVKDKHTQEQNLPMKITDPKKGGGSFWNGTRWRTNQAYPYDSDGKYISEIYESDDAIINVRNIKKEYKSTVGYSGGARGGYIRVVSDRPENDISSYLVSQYYNYNFANNYTVSFTLGGKDNDKTYQNTPEVSLYMRAKVGTSTKSIKLGQPIELSSLKKSNEALQDGQTIYSFETQSFDDFGTLVKNACADNNIKFKAEDGTIATDPENSEELYLNASIGIAFTCPKEVSTAVYLKDFNITSSSEDATEKAELSYRSFNDANSLMSEGKDKPKTPGTNDDNPYYWIALGGKNVIEAYNQTCDILVDEYLVKYGYQKAAVFQETMDSWLGVDGSHEPWIVLDHKNPTLGKLQLTEEGKKHEDEIYVSDIISQQRTTSTVDSSVIIYNYTCRILKYKELGYSSMPVHLFGTEDSGRDLLKYTFSGTLVSLGLGLIVSFINILIGVIWGSISGYFGGVTDIVMERIVDILSGIPSLVLLTVLTLKIGGDHPLVAFALALCLTGWIGTESVTRSQFYRYRGREYVLASKTLGAKAPRLIFRHILPNAIGTIVTSSVLMIPSVIFSEATISYLGLGLQGVNSLGIILSDTQKFLSSYSYQLLLPAVVISLLMICFNLFGNGLRDAFNPSLKGTD